ncbi:hypothetical protein MANES_04G134050v8 [Manihot esculenta]|uniref:Uncharacterized protein n=1 Tax=Manihot esculenta TaxID=3983 RepID=A0ACB7HV78_MANES|nr:hypothetical protein MANES_04G134050v8 [Manihot esculenta]
MSRIDAAKGISMERNFGWRLTGLVLKIMVAGVSLHASHTLTSTCFLGKFSLSKNKRTHSCHNFHQIICNSDHSEIRIRISFSNDMTA